MRSAFLPPDRQGVHACCREERGCRLGEEGVTGGNRKDASDVTQSHRGPESDRIEMTGEVRAMQERSSRGQMLATVNLNPVTYRQVSSSEPAPGETRDRAGQSHLPVKTLDSRTRIQAQITSRFVVPLIHR